jgi:hypothetical protein
MARLYVALKTQGLSAGVVVFVVIVVVVVVMVVVVVVIVIVGCRNISAGFPMI